MEAVTSCGRGAAGGRQWEVHVVQRGQRAATCGVGETSGSSGSAEIRDQLIAPTQ